jgi:hypothetical protein
MRKSVKKTLIVGFASDHNPSLDLASMSDWVGFAAANGGVLLVSVCVDAAYFNSNGCKRPLIR